MRDPERIERMLDKLRAAWYADPDARLGQLVFNAIRGVGSTSKMHGEHTWCLVPLVEDDAMERGLDEHIEFLAKVAADRRSADE